MQDILKKYRKHKYISNVWMVVTSLILAFWINLFLINSTQIGQNLKANVLWVNNTELKSNLYLTTDGEQIKLIAWQQMNWVVSLSFSLAYNPNNLIFENINSEISEITNIENEAWFNSIILNFSESKNIAIWDEILNISVKKWIIKTENINIINANFTDNTGERYLLNTSGITY